MDQDRNKHAITVRTQKMILKTLRYLSNDNYFTGMSEHENYQFLPGVTNKLGGTCIFQTFRAQKSNILLLGAEKTQEKADVR